MAIEQLISCFESHDDSAIGRLGLLPLFVIEYYSMGLGPLSSMANDPEFSLATQRKMTDLEADRLKKALMDYIESANPAHKGMAIGHLARFRDEKLKPFFIIICAKPSRSTNVSMTSSVALKYFWPCSAN